MTDSRSGGYFALHGSALALLAFGNLVTGNAFPPGPPAVRAVSPAARSLGDAFLTLEVVLPVPALLTGMNNGESFDAAITYVQVLAAAGAVEHVLRPARLDSSATMGFGAAVSSAYLFDQSRHVDLRVQGAFWGIQLGLATANATLNVRGGRSGWGSSLLGAGIGTGIGVLAQLAHGGPHSLVPSPALIFDKDNPSRVPCDVRDHVWVLSAVGIAAGLSLPLLVFPAVHDPNLDYEVVPTALGPGSAGLMLRGKL